jgi:putative transposase
VGRPEGAWWTFIAGDRPLGTNRLSVNAKKKEASVAAWRAFLDNHVGELASIDFLTVPTATFLVLFVLIILGHDRRRIVSFNMTEHPTAAGTAQQIAEAFCDGKSPRYLMRDRDGVYGLAFRDRVKALDIEDAVIAPHSPWQNPHVERVIGALRRERLDHVVVLG